MRPTPLRRLRAKARLSQAAVAAIVGVCPRTIQRWERGLRSPSPVQVVRLARVFGVSTDALLAVLATRRRRAAG